MSKGRSLKRSRTAREAESQIIIACEGQKTERLYFEAIRQSLHISSLRIFVVPYSGSDPRNIVLAARTEQLARRRTQARTEKDTTWAVFDGDEHIANNPANWNDALQVAKSNGINLAISNPCFELWYLLHYQDQFGHLHRDTARRLLKGHIPDYEKANVLYPDKLKHLTEDARDRARKLEHYTKTNGLDEDTNPCTHVWKLVENLLKLQKEIAENT